MKPLALPGIRFASFQEALPSDRLSRTPDAGKWELAEYTTTHGGGTMLMCRGGATPAPVTVKPGLIGWHRIHVCLMSSGFPSASILLKLTDDLGGSIFCRSIPTSKYPIWSHGEYSEEYYWKCADMTGQELTIERLHDDAKAIFGLLWVRFEPMDEAEVAAWQADAARRDTRTLHAHTDMDWVGRMETADEKVMAPFVQAMCESDAELLSAEIYPILEDYSFLEQLPDEKTRAMLGRRLFVFPEMQKRQREVYSFLTRECHARGRRVHAALRHCIGEMPPPYDLSAIGHASFILRHPELRCVDRDGERLGSISYAFPEAQEFLVQSLLGVMPYGFDGVTLFFHRGVMTAFEQPVLDLCERLYPGVDARTLPLDDPRLLKVHSELMTAGIRRLREALDGYSREHGLPRLGITIVGCYSVEDTVRYGADAPRWAAEGLIDSVVVGNMRVWEEDESFQDERNPGLVDLEKYRERKYHSNYAPVRRQFYGDDQPMLDGIPGWRDLSRRTGVTVYHEMPWECTRPPQEMLEFALRFYEAGAERISLWDCFHTRVMNRAEWNCVSRLGHREELQAMPHDREGYGTTYRILSLNGISIAAYHPGWRG